MPDARSGELGVTRPLLVVEEPELLDDLLRLTAAAGQEPEVASGVAQARAGWARAPVVAVAAALVPALLAAGFSRRPGVVVVVAGDELADRLLYPPALDLGAERLVHLPAGEGWLVDWLATAADRVKEPATVLATVGGCGGAGATTMAIALALAAARRRLDTLLIDADPLGGGIDVALGAEQVIGLRWPDLAAVRGRVAGRALVGALPVRHGVLVVSWDRRVTPELELAAVSAVFDAARRAADLVIVDLPRHLPEPARLLLSQTATTLVVLPAEVRAAAAAARVTALVSALCADVRVVLRGPAPGRLDPASVAEALGCPLAGALRAEPGLAAAAERGEPPGLRRGPLAALADSFVATL